MATVIAVVFGLMLGSFVSVLVERWPTKEGIVAGRSQCPNCMHQLAWYDLLPLFSWLALRGKCRYCAAPISVRYPLMELAMAASLGLYVLYWGVPSLWYLTDLVVIFALVTLFFFDLRWQLLPDVFTYGLSAILIARLIGLRPDLLVNRLATGAFLAALFLLILLFWEKVLKRDGVGYGDVKLAFVIGLLFGFPDAIGVTLVAIWSGALVGIVLLARGRANLQTALPFGCFWTAAAVAALIWPGLAAWLSGLVLPYI